MPIQPQSNQSAVASAYDHLFKILLLGDSGVGKSSILTRYMDGIFHGQFLSTIGVDFKIKTLDCEGKKVKLQVWDTAGQERFRTITSSYYRGCHGICIIYDVTNKESFANVEKWLKEARQHAPKETRIILLGNKSDDEDRREVSYDIGYQVASSLGLDFFEVSAKTDSNVNEAFFEMIVQMKRVADERIQMIEEAPPIQCKVRKGEDDKPYNQKKGCC